MYDLYVSVRRPNSDKVVQVLRDVVQIVSVGALRMIVTQTDDQLTESHFFIGQIELEIK